MRTQKPVPGTFPREYEVFEIDGAIQKNNGSNWTYAEAAACTDAFVELLEECGLGFGGGIGVPYYEDEQPLSKVMESRL